MSDAGRGDRAVRLAIAAARSLRRSAAQRRWRLLPTPRIGAVAAAVVTLAMAGCRGNGGVDAYVPPADPAATRLGAHTLLAQGEGAGVAPAVTASVATQTHGSSLIAFNAGYASNDAAPSDSHDNRWIALGSPVIYDGYRGRFDVKAYLALEARGGAAHTVQFDKPGNPGGEITVPFVEIRNAGVLRDAAQTYAPKGARQTSASVTTTGPALLVAFWWGDGAGLRHSARPSDGFAVIENFVDLPRGSAVQCVVAVRQVDTAGTWQVSWTVSPAQGAPLWLLAFERNPSAPR